MVGLLGLTNSEPVMSHVRGSKSHVVVMLDHNSAKEALVLLASTVVGLAVFNILPAILYVNH